MKNMKVAMQLGLGFGAVVVLLLLVAGSGLRSMSHIHTQLDDIVNDNVYKMGLVNTMSESVHIVSRVIRTIVLLDEVAAMQTEQAKLDKARTDYDKAWEALEKTTASERGREFRTKIKEAAAAARPMNNKVLELAFANKDEEARAMLMKEAAPLVAKWQDALDNNAAFQAEANKKQAESAAESYRQAFAQMLILAGVALTVSIALAILITRGLMRQLGGEPAYAAEITQQIAAGDMTLDIQIRNNDTSSLLYAMKNMVGKLSHIISEVNTAADALNNAAGQVSQTAQSLSQASSEQAASVEETTASIEQMTASISQNTENAKVTNNMATKSSQEAAEGGEAVKETVEAMKSIAGKIGIIDDIAYQTNLLALNAAIEAARAGEHGKGFAVVAAEVRKLAERSQIAAQEIGELAGSSVKMAEKAGKLLDEMVPSIKKTSDLVQEIAAASSEQSAGVGQINNAMGQLNQATQQNASSSEELAATAEEMGGQAGQLQELMSFFRIDSAATARAPTVRTQTTATRAAPAARPAGKKPAAASAGEQDFERF